MKNYKILSVVIAIAMMMTVLFESMQVDASTLSTVDVSTAKIYDIALSNTGVIADSTTIDNVINQTINTIEGTAQSYKQWCEDNGKVRNATTWQEYLESDAYSTLAWRLSAWILRSTDIINYIITGESLTDELKDMIPSALTGLPAADIAKGFTLPSDVVEDIRNEFDLYVKDYGDYYFINTLAPEHINPLWFQTMEEYEWFKTFLGELEGVLNLFVGTNGKDKNITLDSTSEIVIQNYYMRYITEEFGLVDIATTDKAYFVSVYNTEWTTGIDVSRLDVSTSDYASYSSVNLVESDTTATLSNVECTLGYKTDKYTYAQLGFLTNDGRPLKVFRNLNAYKLFTVGQEPYYVTNNNQDYKTSTDNSVKVTGDYLVDNSTVFSHDIIQETIDNSENITQETVNNIVNEGATTIINNYGSTSSGGGGSDSGNNSILDGLGYIISALSDIVGFLLGVIGDVISLIGSLFTTIFEGLKSFVGIFSGFTGLLGEIFTFLPEELLDFLVLSVEATIGIAIWRKFSK